ncbi:SDR family oxidoreductase [Candidatus Peregrinibacteria bacterium]|nr:SDR family oxidoreductase [Candidatus Peregrinibacteria bacterium]
MSAKKRVLITGGSSGIGLATAQRFAKDGAIVSIVDIKAGEGKAVCDKTGGIFFENNVGVYKPTEENVTKLCGKFGGLDILINCAGIAISKMIWEMDPTEWDSVMRINLTASFYYIRASAPIFRKQKSGVIINISSINALRGKAGLSSYSAAKAGLIGLTRTVARELGKYGVRVNAIAPGWVDTPMTQKYPTELVEKARQESALGKIAKPEDIVNVIYFLCSDEAKHITGVVLPVDGGQTA